MRTKINESFQTQSLSKLEKVRQAFEDWRRTREKLGPIPEELWSAAVELTQSYSLTNVAQALRLNCSDLKKHVKLSKSSLLPQRVVQSTGTENVSKAEFLDISGFGNFQTADRLSECSLEIRDGGGFSMKMHCCGEAGVNVLELCRIVMESR